MKKIYSVITGTGSFIPEKKVKNSDFLSREFYDSSGTKIPNSNEQIIEKFFEITTIAERRYADDEHSTSDLGYFAAQKAIEDAGIDKEELDYIIFAHNFGNTYAGGCSIDNCPSLAARVKQQLGIKNPYSVAYDILFGCPGWLQGVIQGDYYIKAGDAKKILVIGGELLSRISDPHDRDSLIYSDGAGAVILEARESDTPVGILGHNSRTDALHFAQMLRMGSSYKPEEAATGNLYLKMNGRRLYMYALDNVPKTIKAGLDKLNLSIDDVKKVLIHQANGKMDDAILKRLFSLYGYEDASYDVMPMTISWLGNSSVATLPTLFDLVLREEVTPHQIDKGDTIVFASVGAGMNINSFVYKMPED
ncbi:MAG TPA: ketoacyl-ACP synthase III [Dysgonamonadaceae bacterium]|nr:ketoacyl-ACP synthase III [Dysgonamonadaceae bacterium]